MLPKHGVECENPHDQSSYYSLKGAQLEYREG